MQNIYNLVDLGQVIARLRALIFPDLVLGRWLPNVTVNRTNYRYALNDRSQQRAASFIPWDAEAPIGGRPGMTVREGQLPPIKEKRVLTESDQILVESLSDVMSDAMVASVFGDAILGLRSILQRLELAKGEALSRGQVTINERGLILTVTFGVPSAHMDVAPGTLWTTANLATATPLTNLTTWRDTYVANNGQAPGALVLSTETMSFLQRADEMVGAYGTNRSRITREEVNALLQGEDLPTPTVYDAQYKNSAGSLTRAIAADRVLFLPDDSAGFGETQIGRTREAVELAGQADIDLDAAGGVPGIVAVTMKSFDPVELWTKVAGVALPVIEDPTLIFSADVR